MIIENVNEKSFSDERKFVDVDPKKNMLEVEIENPESPDTFLKIRETLTRIGVASKENILFQSCHILHKRGKYYIVHFKELFALDGKMVNFTQEDKLRRNKIASLLEDWGLLTIVNPEKYRISSSHRIRNLKIVPYKEVQNDEWELQTKYNIGK